jgi:uncharacterized protein
MKIDIHCHAIGNGKNIDNIDNDVYFYPEDNQLFFTRFLYNMVESNLSKLEADLNNDNKISTSEYFEFIYNKLLTSKELDGIVILAMDAVYSHQTGIRDDILTDLWISNKFLSQKVTEMNKRLQNEPSIETHKKKFFFGASVNPNRLDWRKELDYVINDSKAVLIKLIPSTQHINLTDDRHKEYFTILAQKEMPLLCHVGPEYSFPEGLKKGNKELDNFRNLKGPLECGVTVIAAHCASPVFPLIDKNETDEFYEFMKSYNGNGKIKLWSDTSALSLSTRLPILPKIMKTFPPEWLVHGSDYPIPIDGWPHLPLITPDITIKEYLNLMKTKNPFDLDILIKRYHGFSDIILENTEKVLENRLGKI